LDPEEYILIDTETPWYQAVRSLVEEVERPIIKVLDANYADAVIFNDVMAYLDLTETLTMEIVDYVHFG
jgi:hypothetical protein